MKLQITQRKEINYDKAVMDLSYSVNCIKQLKLPRI